MDKRFNIEDQLSFADASEKHSLRGHVTVSLENKETGETKLWYENDNTISISGFQWILFKMFGLHLDSIHDPSNQYEDLGQDSTIVIPDLNESGVLGIGVDPTEYTVMEDDISARHIIQGFMVGNGGSGEDGITTKNTDYSFIKLRNPIPFQQTDSSLDPSISGKYLGVYREDSGITKSYFIKKFDNRPHVYHNWWRDGQSWDYMDPVKREDLGPDAQQTPKTNRIETYVEVGMSIDTNNGDCMGIFLNQGNNQTPAINELGLVAFDTIPGTRSIAEELYTKKIKKLISLIFSQRPNSSDEYVTSEADDQEVITLASEAYTVLSNIIPVGVNVAMDAFIATLNTIKNSTVGSIPYGDIQTELILDTNIKVEAYYDINGNYTYETDSYLEIVGSYSNLSLDEAQRIKMITYYTFNSIPLNTNWKVLINYRIYAN